MEISRIRALRGPNLWSRHTAIQALVLCEENENALSHLPGFEARIRARPHEWLWLHDRWSVKPWQRRRYGSEEDGSVE